MLHFCNSYEPARNEYDSLGEKLSITVGPDGSSLELDSGGGSTLELDCGMTLLLEGTMLELDGTTLELDGVTLELEHSISPVIGFILQPDELELLGTTEEEDGTIADEDCTITELLDSGTVPAAILVGTS